MDSQLWRARAEIDVAALKHNIFQVRNLIGKARILAVIKADAYGHGLDNISSEIWPDVDGFAVATVNEGIQCRQVQSQKPVVVLSEFWSPQHLADFEAHSLDPVIHNEAQLPWILEYSGSPLSVWIKFDSGMNRLGIDPERVSEYFEMLSTHSSIANVRLISHLANADVPGDTYTEVQLNLFNRTVRDIRTETSLANTAGIMKWEKTHMNWVRPGLMIYGISPYTQDKESQIPLRPVMNLKARIIAVKKVGAGQPVGYGGGFVTSHDTVIAIVGVGYGDGYPRVVDSRACVLIKGQRAPIIGRVSMDMITVDITDISGIRCGDDVVLWGPDLDISEVADWAGTIPYELLCKVTPRIPRVLMSSAIANG